MSVRLARRPLLATLSFGLAAPALAQIHIPKTTFAILGAESPSHWFKELLLDADGRRHRLFIAVPRAAPPPEGHRILYMLDGNAAFDVLTPELLGTVPGMVLVGVGYDTELRFSVEERALDYTPPMPGAGPTEDPLRPGRLTGGAEAFLARLIGPLRLAAEEGLAIDPARRALWGHSFGGLFALFSLFSAPDAFRLYVAISPSLWWGEERLTPYERLERRAETGLRDLMIALGDSEQRTNAKGPAPAGPAPQTLALVERLRVRDDLRIRLDVLRGLDHGDTLEGSLPEALAFAAASAKAPA